MRKFHYMVQTTKSTYLYTNSVYPEMLKSFDDKYEFSYHMLTKLLKRELKLKKTKHPNM